jgi:hypothetical protein
VSLSAVKSGIFNLLLALVIIFAPSNLFLVLCDGCGYVNGLQSDYLLPKLYLVDLLLLTVMGWGIVAGITNWSLVKKWLKPTLLGLSIWTVFGIRQFWAPFPLAGLWTFTQYTLLGLAGYTVYRAWRAKVFAISTVVVGFLVGLILQSSLSWYQFTYQRPLFDYQVLGETDLRRVTGLSTLNFTSQQQVAPYGTTAHPNLLAGYLAGYSLILVGWLMYGQANKTHQVVAIGGLLLGLSALWLTQSTSGAAMLVTGGVTLGVGDYLVKRPSFAWWKTAMLSLIVVCFLVSWLTQLLPTETNSVVRRQYLLTISQQLIKKHWLFGSGLANFTAISEPFSPTTEVVRFNQPVHHSGWLWVAETGILGGLVVLYCWWLTRTNQSWSSAIAIWLFISLPVLVWDHYLLSLEPGRALCGILLAACFFMIKKLRSTASSKSGHFYPGK